MTEKLLNKHFHLVSPYDLDLWPSYPRIYTALLQVIIYQLAKYERNPIEKWQRNFTEDDGMINDRERIAE